MNIYLTRGEAAAGVHSSSDIERMKSALAHVFPEVRNTSLRIAMALKAELSASAFPIRDEGSQGGQHAS